MWTDLHRLHIGDALNSYNNDTESILKQDIGLIIEKYFNIKNKRDYLVLVFF